MITSSKNIVLRFAACRSGNFLVIGAVVMVPVIGLAGAALDYSRASDFRTRVQQAADAAVLASAQTEGNFEQKKTVGVKVFQANTADLGNINLTPIFSPITNGVHVDISASIGNTFMKAMGKASSGFEVKSEAVMAVAGSNGTSGSAVEIALALDTTGSMKNDIGALRTSAASLVSTVMKNPNVYVSVVPFVAAVNVGATNIPMSAMDTGADAKWHGMRFKAKFAAKLKNCGDTNNGGGAGPVTPSGGHVEGSLQLFQKRFAFVAQELFGIHSARADVTPNTIPPYTYWDTAKSKYTGATGQVPQGFYYDLSKVGYPLEPYSAYLMDNECRMINPVKISHFDLFNRIPGAKWKGCVEARAEPYDVTDDAPNPANADTLFVPYFWGDEFDASRAVEMSNNYMPDQDVKTWPQGFDTGPNALGTGDWYGEGALLWNILKYNGIGPVTIKETPPDTLGPNKACPDELLRLSNNKTKVLNKVQTLDYWSNGGTIASEGLAWAWRTVSPNAPFADAKAYSKDNKKYVVLMSDGVNEISANVGYAKGYTINPAVWSDYSAYGHLEDDSGTIDTAGRFKSGSSDFTGASAYFDQRLATACTNAKAKGIQIYTVLFRETATNAVNNLRSCATKPEMAYKAADQTALKNAFDAIANDISMTNGGNDKLMPRLVK